MQSLWLLVVSAIACGHLSLVEGKCETPWQDCGKTREGRPGVSAPRGL